MSNMYTPDDINFAEQDAIEDQCPECRPRDFREKTRYKIKVDGETKYSSLLNMQDALDLLSHNRERHYENHEIEIIPYIKITSYEIDGNCEVTEIDLPF